MSTAAAQLESRGVEAAGLGIENVAGELDHLFRDAWGGSS
jgi:hypothetical protein